MDKINIVRMDNVEGYKTIQDVHAFIIKHLKHRCNQPCEIIQDETWTIIAGFSIDLYCHNVYVNNSTHEYAVHAFVKLYDDHNLGFPNFGRYNTYSDMIIGFVNKYAELWQIDNTIDDFLQRMESLEKSILDGQRAYVLNSDLLEIRCNFKYKKCFTLPSYADGSGNYYCYTHSVMIRLDPYKYK
jgi:hypothetical protein